MKKLFIAFFICLSAIAAKAYVHPGLAHSQADLDRMKQMVNEKKSPWIDGWNLLLNDYRSSSSYTPAPRHTIGGTDGTRQRATKDATAAYLNMLRWYVTGNTANAECAIKILNAWSDSVKSVISGELFQLPMGVFVQAGELARLYSGWKSDDMARFKNMCLNYFYPACKNFIGYCDSWPGWDGPANTDILYIGIFCDDTTKVNEALDYYKNGEGGGCITNMITQTNGQTIEMGRDMPHTEIPLQWAAEFCQATQNQGIDMFSYKDNILLTAFEYWARYNLEHVAPGWVPYLGCSRAARNFYYPSNRYANRITGMPGCEIIYSHYVGEKGLGAPYTQAMINLRGLVTDGWDAVGYTAVTQTLSEDKSPYTALAVPDAPKNLKATNGLNNVYLEWTPSSWATINGSVIQRATSLAGPYTTVGQYDMNTSNFFLDSLITTGMTYYYRVAGKNNTGVGAYSDTICIKTEKGLPVSASGWSIGDVGAVAVKGTASYSPSGNRSFLVNGSGNSFGGSSADGHTFLYHKLTGNSTLTMRLNYVNQSGSEADRVGIIMRESLSGTSRMVSIGQADVDMRYVWVAPRISTGYAVSGWYAGNTHTWESVWFRISRSANSFSCYQSKDGVSWYLVKTITDILPSTYYGGLFICSGTSSKVTTTVYVDNVTISGGGQTSPAAPATLKASPKSSKRINLTWNSDANVQAYNISRSTSAAGPFEVIAENYADTVYSDSTLNANTTYYYSIKSVNFSGVGIDSATVSSTTLAKSVPSTPENVILYQGYLTLYLMWNGVDDASSYILQRSTSENGTYSTIATLSAPGYTDSGVSLNTTYYYRVIASNELGSSDATSPVSETVTSATRLTGEIIGTDGSNGNVSTTTKSAALDGSMSTYFDAAEPSGAWVGYDFGETTRAVISQIRYVPRSTYPGRMVNGQFQVSNDSDFADAITIASVATQPSTSTWTKVSISYLSPARYVRYLSPTNGYCNIADMLFYGHKMVVDGINDITYVTSDDDNVYALDGRNVTSMKLKPGIYIKNKKKIIVR